jgi:putative aldouronate transport system permease protein
LSADKVIIPTGSGVTIKKNALPRWLKNAIRNRYLYLLISPGLIYFFLFKYVPIWGLIISFQDYLPFLGISGSEWVGFKHFERFFTEPTFWMLFKNTLILFGLNLVFVFPVPIILALMLNEVRQPFFKRTVQTMVYVPYFLSWVIVVSLTFILLTPEGGMINKLIEALGGQSTNFLASESWFRPIYIIQIIWKEAGWGTILYLAAMAGIDTQLYEAARMDGAGRLRQLWHITLPGIRGVIVMLLILKVGSVLELGFDHIFLMLNSMNREVAEIFDTYVYTTGIKQGQFSYSTAIGMFKSVVGLIMVLIANRIAKLFGEEGIY